MAVETLHASAARIADSRTRISRSNSVACTVKSESCGAAAGSSREYPRRDQHLGENVTSSSSIYKYPDLGICLSVETGITMANSICLNLQLRAPLRRQESSQRALFTRKLVRDTCSLFLSLQEPSLKTQLPSSEHSNFIPRYSAEGITFARPLDHYSYLL
ncbi:hypothetical protein K0M31_009182 [Melipona bicolor]|uniref:Uncharacterized protein n=1 Tax=Melipona bicolor TaxID=60889 RepID=A0AA40KJI7_9HYME|nr:hypothetical protein K0M31_009182 [Melipona bicolor]